jgi:anti-sigma regulatory factor (Ser/Thr protein kinase)
MTVRAPKIEVPVVDPVRFVDATRDSGYRHVATAVAELMDNAVQAAASEIAVLVRDVGQDDPDFEIAVLDNGEGIIPTHLRSALQFGGTHRFNSRTGLGRFGMGLPNASVSQARRVDLYSWESRRPARAAYLDVDRIQTGDDAGIRIVPRTSLPDWLAPYRRRFRTAVVWSRCDRIPYRRISTVIRVLRSELGRLFRRVLQSGTQIHVNAEPVQIVDPVRILPRPDDAEVELLPRLEIPFGATDRDPTPTVSVQFTLLPIEEWSRLPNSTKRRFGITKWGGVSIMRQSREIAYGWYFLPNKRRENYDDWWRCEVSFPPTLDEAFGVTHTKQGIRPSPDLIDALAPVIGGQARRLNRDVRQRFEAMNQGPRAAELRAEDRENRLRDQAAPPRAPTSVIRVSRGGRRYRIRVETSSDRAFFRCVVRQNDVTVYVNRLHPFYTQLYAPLLDSGNQDLSIALNAFILALGRASKTVDRSSEFIDRLSDLSAVFMERR